jgi:hypothetical protein
MNLDAVPAALVARPQWVDWRSDPERGKIPVNPRTGNNASTDKPGTWGTLKTARDGLNRHSGLSGVGFVFAAEDEFVGVDLDNCLEADGTCKPWALPILALFPGAYVERTPSGRGLHIITVGTLPPNSRHKVPHADGHLEVYDRLRFFTMTGRPWGQVPAEITGTQEAVEEFVATFIGVKEPERVRSTTPSEPVDLDDRALLDRMFASRGGHGLEALWRGDTGEYGGDDSRADLALCNHLAFWTNRDAGRIDRLFRQSGLYREKWDREDYRARTIERALAGTTEGYRMQGRREAVPPPGEEDAPATDWVALHEPERRANEARRKLESMANGHAALADDEGFPTLAELMAREIPRPKWIIDGLIPEGLSCLFGKPKMRKSWMAFGTALAVCTGGRALGIYPVQQRDVVYLALEDAEWRLQDRLKKIGVREKTVTNIYYQTKFPRFGKGGEEKICRFLDSHPGVGYVIFDTYARVKPPQTPGSNAYEHDSNCIELFKNIADHYHIAVLVIHHQRKAVAEDWIDSINGSSGIAGSADTLMLLQATRGEAKATLRVTGRDVETEDYHLSWQDHCWGWVLEGTEEEWGKTRDQHELIEALRFLKTPADAKQVHQVLSDRGIKKSEATIRRTLYRMVFDASVINHGGGLFGVRTAN